MTLSRFLRDYIYIPLGGNRRGRKAIPEPDDHHALGGLWHGAGWTFVVWGVLHGVYLSVHHAWQGVRHRIPGASIPVPLRHALAVTLTFLAVNVAWVVFRAPELRDGVAIIGAMFGSHGVAIPEAIVSRLGVVGNVLQQAGIRTYLGGGSQFIEVWAWVLGAAVITFAFPNTQEIMRRCEPTLQPVAAPSARGSWPA